MQTPNKSSVFVKYFYLGSWILLFWVPVVYWTRRSSTKWVAIGASILVFIISFLLLHRSEDSPSTIQWTAACRSTLMLLYHCAWYHKERQTFQDFAMLRSQLITQIQPIATTFPQIWPIIAIVLPSYFRIMVKSWSNTPFFFILLTWRLTFITFYSVLLLFVLEYRQVHFIVVT